MKQIYNLYGTIIFTDIKDFTLKTSLLTQNQIDEILKIQEIKITKHAVNNKGKIVKSIGDSFMLFFENPIDAVNCAIEIQKDFILYNLTKKLPLFKIELKISIDYGILNKKDTISGYDYFGDTVNLASRVVSKTPENKIFITHKLYDSIKKFDKFNIVKIGSTSFKGIIYNVDIYEILFLKKDVEDFKKNSFDIKKYENILKTEKQKTKEKEIDEMILKCSSLRAILGTQPIPFFDVYHTIIHIYMIKYIGDKYGFKIDTKEAKQILSIIVGRIGISLLGQQAINGFGKIRFVGITGFLMISLNFGITYGTGIVIHRYFYNKSKNVPITKQELKELFLSSKDKGIKYAKENKESIKKIGNDFKITFLKLKKEI